ncbi:MAG: matrixin family metalloprotease [Gemmatimonadales bacterium]
MRAPIALAIAAFALGCSEIATPVRAPRYLFDVGGEVFHWPADRLPVRYFADSRGSMASLVREGLGMWEVQFLYGEFRGVLVTDSTAADVIVLWQDSVPPDVAPDTAGALGACDGVTTYQIDTTNAMEGPIRVALLLRPGFTTAQIAACVHRVAAHELGHTLGILTHSPAPTDLMFDTPGTQIPTHRDRNTVQVLYHTTSTIAPPPR